MTDINLDDILCLMLRWERRLLDAGVHDNQKCHGLKLDLHADGSGTVMAIYTDVLAGDDENEQIRRTVMTMRDHPIMEFGTLAELHGGLVAHTTRIAK